MSKLYYLRAATAVLCACLLCIMMAVPAAAVAAPAAPATAAEASLGASPKASPGSSANSTAGDTGKGLQDGELMPAIFYYNSRGFVLSPQPGWVNDVEIARHVGVNAFYLTVGKPGEAAPGAIYLRLHGAQGTGEAAVDAQTAFVAADMAKRFPDTRPMVEKGEGGVIASGEPFYLRRINQAPPPNSWESVVYVESDGVLLSLVLLCKSPRARQVYEPQLLAMAKNIRVLQVKHEK